MLKTCVIAIIWAFWGENYEGNEVRDKSVINNWL